MRVLILALAMLIVAGEARAACTGKIIGINAQAPLTYSPFASWNATQKLVLSIQNTGNATCAFQVSIPSSFYPLRFGGKLAFAIESPGSQASIAQLFSAVTPAIGASQTVKLDIVIKVFRGQVAASGAFSAEAGFVLTAANASLGQPPLDQAVISLSCTVPPIFEINIAGSGQQTTVQFDELAAQKAATVVLQTRTTGNHTLQLSSKNQGYLVGQGPAAQAGKIPYSLNLDGQPVALGTPSSLTFTAAPGEAARRLTITVGSTAGTLAGTYSDVITINIESSL